MGAAAAGAARLAEGWWEWDWEWWWEWSSSGPRWRFSAAGPTTQHSTMVHTGVKGVGAAVATTAVPTQAEPGGTWASLGATPRHVLPPSVPLVFLGAKVQGRRAAGCSCATLQAASNRPRCISYLHVTALRARWRRQRSTRKATPTKPPPLSTNQCAATRGQVADAPPANPPEDSQRSTKRFV